jgi:hypothetical protein
MSSRELGIKAKEWGNDSRQMGKEKDEAGIERNTRRKQMKAPTQSLKESNPDNPFTAPNPLFQRPA